MVAIVKAVTKVSTDYTVSKPYTRATLYKHIKWAIDVAKEQHAIVCNINDLDHVRLVLGQLILSSELLVLKHGLVDENDVINELKAVVMELNGFTTATWKDFVIECGWPVGAPTVEVQWGKAFSSESGSEPALSVDEPAAITTTPAATAITEEEENMEEKASTETKTATTGKRYRRSNAECDALVQEYRASGLSDKDFAKTKGIQLRQFLSIVAGVERRRAA